MTEKNKLSDEGLARLYHEATGQTLRERDKTLVFAFGRAVECAAAPAPSASERETRLLHRAAELQTKLAAATEQVRQLRASVAELEESAAPAPSASPANPIDMVLHCPSCGVQHIDAPERDPHDIEQGLLWDNPPHRSHLCHGCGHIWRPADVPTNGVAAVKTKGNADSPIGASPAALTDERELDLYDEIESDLNYLFGRASKEGHEAGQELAKQVKAKMQRARALLAASPIDQGEDARDAARYRFMRNSKTDLALVIDKIVGEMPYDTGTRTGGYSIYEYRADEELDSAIDAAMPPAKEQ